MHLPFKAETLSNAPELHMVPVFAETTPRPVEAAVISPCICGLSQLKASVVTRTISNRAADLSRALLGVHRKHACAQRF